MYPDLMEDAREQLGLNQYLAHVDNPQVASSAKQAKPKITSDALRLTLEIEAELQDVRSLTPQQQPGASRGRRTKTKFRRKPFHCWNCGGEGHADKDRASPRKQMNTRKQGNGQPSVQ